MSTVSHHFTFSHGHMTNFPLPFGGQISDYWVTVTLPEDHPVTHREIFIDHFTGPYCPSENQFAMEYGDYSFNPDFFIGGLLCVVTEEGIQK